VSDEQRSERVAALLAARPRVAHEVAQVQRAREGSLEGARAIARRLRPSGGLGRELREHPLQVLGIAAALGLIGLRWLTGSRRSRSNRGEPRVASEGSGVVSAFAAGLAAAAAEKGGRAVIDALLDSRPPVARSTGARTATLPVDETGGAAHDDQGRVAKR
jgi:hypothetical protein